MTEKKEDSFWVPNWGPLLAQTTVEDDLVKLLLRVKRQEGRRRSKMQGPNLQV